MYLALKVQDSLAAWGSAPGFIARKKARALKARFTSGIISCHHGTALISTSGMFRKWEPIRPIEARFQRLVYPIIRIPGAMPQACMRQRRWR
jgi:hypothetical protein